MSEEEKNAKLYISGQMLLRVVEELESRIDKAIEYIKYSLEPEEIESYAASELLEILGDKEWKVNYHK